jgi:hypothetical protein
LRPEYSTNEAASILQKIDHDRAIESGPSPVSFSQT